jgi:hypothetical protein
MGKVPDTGGVRVYQYDQAGAATGTPTSSHLFPWAFFTGAPRPPGRTGGSDDWLQEIYVADTGSELGAIIQKFPPQTDPRVAFLTSGASLGAYVISSLQGHTPQCQTGGFVIATNTNQSEPNIANQIHVSPTDPEKLPSGSPLAQLWKLEKTRLQATRQTPPK